MPLTAAAFLLGSVAIVGLPPLNGFVSEWIVLQALLLGGMTHGPTQPMVFAAAGLGRTTVPVLPWLLPVLAMKKVVVGAALAAVVAVGWWTWPRSDAPPVVAQVGNPAASPAAASLTSKEVAANEAGVDAVRTSAVPRVTRDEAFVVRVADTGKGIPPAMRGRVFQPGFTTKRRGWGLGLVLVLRIVEEYHGGRIWIEDNADRKGVCFAVRLPAAPG